MEWNGTRKGPFALKYVLLKGNSFHLLLLLLCFCFVFVIVLFVFQLLCGQFLKCIVYLLVIKVHKALDLVHIKECVTL